MVPREEQVDEVAEGGDEGGDIREGGSIQDGIHAGGFLAGADDPHLLQDRLEVGQLAMDFLLVSKGVDVELLARFARTS